MARKSSKKRSSGSVLLSRGRGVQKPASLSSKAGRTLIRSHHTLQKQLAQALSRSDDRAAAAARAEIEANGGLEKYQKASIKGQSAQRGGDSSKLLMSWFQEERDNDDAGHQLRLLEVGSLSPDNAVSRSPLFSVARIDLHSQHPSIETQDFMARPLPASDAEKFDVISLSLVLNYVSSPDERGEMLRRTARFLRHATTASKTLTPSLFLVLPAPCVRNSRYLTEKRLQEIMRSCGYEPAKRKLSAKLIYGLWRLSDVGAPSKRFKKDEVNPGKMRNNFAVVLK